MQKCLSALVLWAFSECCEISLPPLARVQSSVNKSISCPPPVVVLTVGAGRVVTISPVKWWPCTGWPHNGWRWWHPDHHWGHETPEGREQLLVLKTINRWSCTLTEKAPTRAFSWLKAATSTFTFKNLLRHYAKWALIHSRHEIGMPTQRLTLNARLAKCLSRCEKGGSRFQQG